MFIQAIHEGQDCKQYQQAMLNESQDENSIKTKEWIEVTFSKIEKISYCIIFFILGLDFYWGSPQLSKLSSHSTQEMGL